MLLLGLLLGLVLGLLVGGRLENLAVIRLRWLGPLFAAVVVRFVVEIAIARGNPFAEAFRLPLLALGYGGLLAALWANRRLTGIPVAFVGILLNAVAIVVNGGAMPVWEPSLTAAGFGPGDLDSLHVILPAPLDATFMLRGGPFGDIVPLPLPFLGNVLSIGDIVMTIGLGSFLFATLVRPLPDDEDLEPRLTALPGIAVAALASRPSRVRSATGLMGTLAQAAALDRPTVLGGTGLGLSAPGVARRTPALHFLPTGLGTLVEPTVGERVLAHPYVRLALDGRFSALWTGQLISLFGDRLHQIALAFLVLGVTGSPLAVGLVFVAATLPNLLLGPVAGTLVDRWDQKRVLVLSDVIRAGVVLTIPALASINVFLVYPLVFVLTSVSVFFRPARAAVLPRLVREKDLLTANSAMWVGETLADVVGYPVAGLFVAFIGTAALPLAFWLDGASYVVSAMLIGSLAIPALARAAPVDEGAEPAPSFRRELADGLTFLRREVVLFVNTLQGIAGQIANGALVAVAPVYALRVLVDDGLDPVAAYALLETGIGVGSLVGGFAIGLLGGRVRKGPLVAIGYIGWGLAMAGLALTTSLPVAVALMVTLGFANMASVIPSQTLFQERTPPELIGRVVGTRFSLVFGATTLAMAAGGAIAGTAGVGPVLVGFGLVACVGGVLGLLVPAARRA